MCEYDQQRHIKSKATTDHGVDKTINNYFIVIAEQQYMVIENKNTYHFFESSYFNVAGTDTRADSMFLKEPPFTLDSICSKITFEVQKNQLHASQLSFHN